MREATDGIFRQVAVAAGHTLLTLLPGALLLVGLWLRHPGLELAVVMLLFPFARLIFGADEHATGNIAWSERIATLLDHFPIVCVVWVVFCLCVVARHLAVERLTSISTALGLLGSCWVMCLFATCVSHELIHRRLPRQALLGSAFAGVVGYPFLGSEHLLHHARDKNVALAEWPRVNESVWSFATRRIGRIAREAVERQGRLLHIFGDRTPLLDHARAGYVAWILTLLSFALSGGWAAATFYVVLSILVTFGVQLITYLQHWGLGHDDRTPTTMRSLAWEDDCLFQAFVTLKVSYHQAHHDQARRPYYRLELVSGSPRLPAGYVVLMVLALFPRAWFLAMKPVLEAWKSTPNAPTSVGRRLTCFADYRR